MTVLSTGHLGSICRQTSLALGCLSTVLNRCTGMSRYLVALIADEMQLTSDLWCSEVSCRINLASQCLEDGMRIIDYPVAIEMQSNLICRGVKSSLACITNNTDLCELDTIPQYLSNGFMQLYQFSAAFCASETGNGVTSGLPRDLIAPVYLAALTANEWTSVNDMCSVYNATLRMAATERISMATNIEHLLTWQQVTSISLDKLSDMCLNNHSYNCQWVEILANQNPVCDVETAKQCVDMVLLSKLTVDVILMRSSWQTVCSVAYDMLACAQYHTRACVTSDLSEVLEATQEVEDLVGYECNQLGASGSQEVCDVEHKLCDSASAVHECIMVAYGFTDRCKEQEKLYNCFKNHLHACNSIQKVPAQFTFEWLLNNCSTNLTLLEEDMYIGVSQCKLRYGYNIFNGLLTYSDFNSMICAVTSLYRQCLADQSFPSLATLYMQEVDDFFSFMQQTTCNNTQSSSDISTVEESNECSFVETAGTVTLSIEFYSNFPFMSLKDQEVVCRTYPSFKDIWVSRATSCTARRQKLISDAIVYFDKMHDSLCSVSRADVPRSCDETRANICLEDFGSFTYFATKNSDVCGKLEDTYNCLMESTTGCDESTHNALLQEVKTMHSMLGNVTCPKMQWCTTVNSTDLFPWQREICSEWNKCLIFDWMTCVDQFNLQFSCQSSTEGIVCIEHKLSSCDPLQILLAKSEISAWVQQNSACNVVPSDPPAVTQVYRNIYECSSYISMATEISKQALCFMINQYINCLASLDQSEVPRVWRGVLGRNGQLWRKRLYMDCQISSSDNFIVGQDFDLASITGQFCLEESQYCLRSFTSLALTYFHIVPLSERQETVCERAKAQYDCVMAQAAGCLDQTDRYLMTSAEWIRGGLDNVGTCSSNNNVARECSPELAMKCIADLGQVLIEDMDSTSVDVVCSKLHLTSLCVNQRTSSCDYYTRADVSKTFNQISAIIKDVCTPSPPTTPSTSCLPQGEVIQCDLEEALICMVPVQAMLLHPNSTWEQVCRSIPEMKACVHRATSGCDQVTLGIVSNKLHRLSHKLNDQCPQIYCEECLARSCIVNLQRSLQYENASLCGSIAAAKQCIYQHAGYCDPSVGETLLREIPLLVGNDAYLCEITLPSCLQNFMMTAYQITNYMPMTNMSNDYVLTQMCNEATAAFYCINTHMTSFEGQRLDVMNSTLQQIGKIVYGKCQGPQLQCYSCVNATSNEDCNQQRVQTCPPDMQMCGTVFTGTVLNKGCVKPDLCQNGCNGVLCSMCCGTSLCNQPWNDVILESPTCQPEAAMFCGFQMISSLVQNETINCLHLQEYISCMIQSTQDCTSSQNMALGIHARDLLTRDVMSTCLESSPVCGCGQCSSMLLLSVVASPFGNVDGFCKTVLEMYERTLKEMDLTDCSTGHIQSTAYNVQMAAYMIQGICYLHTIDNRTCNHGYMVYSHGETFMADDGCNYCTCDRGNIGCTLMYCPPEHNQQCPDIDPDQAGVCIEMCRADNDCYNGQICCSNGCGHVCSDPKPQGADSCKYGNSSFSTGDSFLASDGCNFCYCYDGMISCTEMYCPSVNDSCWYNGRRYNNGDSFQADDGCNSCFCSKGNVACTLMLCPPVADDKDCLYNGATYFSGDNFLAADGCNHCFCNNGTVGCTLMYCPKEDVCDVLGVQQCINDASLPYLVSMATGSKSRHVCLSAANLLKCVDSKVKGCPTTVLEIAHNAVWWNIQSVQYICDVNDLIWSFHNGGWQTNTTELDTTGKCSIQNAVKCFVNIDETCDCYQTMVDCVYDFSTGCLSVDMVPVLFELERHLEKKIADCDLVIPEQNVDPFHPIAQCLADFGKSLNSELTVAYLQSGKLGRVCDSIATLIYCVHNISYTQPAGKLLVQNLLEMLSNLFKQCNELEDHIIEEAVKCHQCHGLADMDMCDSMPLQKCHHNQVCATSLQQDPYTGLTMVTKGCANQAWCHANHGCNIHFMSCVACCHGDLCNSANNMTANVTEAPRSTSPTTQQPTQPWRTSGPTRSTTTNSYDTCQLDYISTLLTSHVLRLMTFNFLPIYDRRHMCEGFEDVFAMVSSHLDPNCPEVVTEHVRKLLDWLSPLTTEVCNVEKNNEKCSEAIVCISDMEHFTDKNTTCRSISKAMSCLQTHYQYCNVQGQMSINRTRHILSDMHFVVCEPNILIQGQAEVECVPMATKDLISGKCDVNATMQCAAHIRKAFHNPFLSQDDMCRIAKQGLNCIQNNSMNCSMDALGSMSSAVLNLVQGVSSACPNVWCPVNSNCTLEPARKCMASLESEVQKQFMAGNFNKSICKSITRTHHCIMNASQNCNLPGAHDLLQQFNAIVILTSTWCTEEPIYHNECLNGLHHAIDNLVQFDTDFVNYILRTNLQMTLVRFVLSKDFDDNTIKNGLSILGLDTSFLPLLRNDSDIIIPSVIGYLFKNKNIEGVDLQALAHFIGEVATVNRVIGGFGEGLNLPGGGFGSNHNGTNSGFGGINLPGEGYGTDRNETGPEAGGINLPGVSSGTGGDFGYGLALAGGYSNSDDIAFIDIDKNIHKIASLLFRSNTFGTDLTLRFLNIMNKTAEDVVSLIDEKSLIMYNQRQHYLCDTIHELLHCAYGNMYSSLMSSSKRQEFIAETTLGLLEGLASGMCQEVQCHSCYGLHNNKDCNMQPVTSCEPLQMCQTKISDDHYYKGCASALTCEEECKRTRGPCYCCRGQRCNKYEEQLHDEAKCDTQKAVDAAYDLLNFSMNAGTNHNQSETSLVYTKANQMIMATDGCYATYQRNFGTEGERIIKLLEAENCTNHRMSKECNDHELKTLHNLIHTPYFTTKSVDTVCSLFNVVSRKVVDNISRGKCCDSTVIETLITMYTLINSHCDNIRINQLCDVKLHSSCQNHSSQTSDGKRQGNSEENRQGNLTDTTEDILQQEQRDFINNICSQISKDQRQGSNNLTGSDVTVKKESCNVVEAIGICFGLGMDCSDIAIERLSECMSNRTSFCSPTQLVMAATTMDRVAFSCGRDISISQDLISVDMQSQHNCLQELTKIKATSSESSILMSSLCDIMQSVSGCLATSNISSAPNYNMYLSNVKGKVDHTKTFACNYDMSVEAQGDTNETCDVTMTAEIAIQYLNFMLTGPVVLGSDDCFFGMELEELKHSLENCPGNNARQLDDLLSWMELDVKVSCNANLAGISCQRSTCDISMATNLLQQIGYYLMARNLDERVVCKKVTNVLDGVHCVVGNCTEEDVTFINKEVLYIRSLIGTRCNTLTDHLYCNNKEIFQGNESSGRNSTNMRNPQRGILNETQSFENGTLDGRACNVMQAKLCANNVRLPSAEDGLYCSKMRLATETLSACVAENLAGCKMNDITPALVFYQDLFSHQKQYCYTKFLTVVFADLLPTEQCYIPECSHITAMDCLKHFNASLNVDDIEQCIIYATEGCNAIQQSALMLSLQALSEKEHLPDGCIKHRRVVDSEAEYLVKCVTDFTQQIEEALFGNMSGSPTCHLISSYLGCLENTFALDEFPVVIKETANHLLKVARPSVDLACKETDDKTSEEKMMRQGHSNETCYTREAVYCLRKFSTNALLLPLLSPDGKEMICSHLSDGRNCLTEALLGCPLHDMTSKFFTLYNTIEMLAQLSGVCSPHPMVCSPEIAMECISNLGLTLGSMSPHYEVCGNLFDTEICVQQTTSGCDDITKTSIRRAYEPISCKAYSLCPNAIMISDESKGKHKTCIDPADVVAHGGSCKPSVALKCLQDIFSVSDDRYSTCRQYESSLNCFFNNINGCKDDAIVQITMYYLLYISAEMDTKCGITIKHGCDTEDSNCDLNILDDCIAKFNDTEKSENEKARCLGRKEVKQCFEVSTKSCPRIARLYAKTKLLKHSHTNADSNAYNCDNVNQCVYNYMHYFNLTLSNYYARSNDDGVDRDDGQTVKERMVKERSDKELDQMKLYQCHSRLEEITCIESHLKMLPDDVAMVTGDLLTHIDHIFADLCSIQMGLLPDLQGCNKTCIECLQNRNKHHNELTMLLTFISDSMNASSDTVMFSSSKFCRLFDEMKVARKESMNMSCIDDHVEAVWQSKHVEDMISLYDTYCDTPCNTTQADYCINQLEIDLLNLNKEESCLVYNETIKCLGESVTSCEATTTNQYMSQAELMFRNTGIVCYKLPEFEISYTSSEFALVEGEMFQTPSISVTMMTPVMDSCYGNSCKMEIFVSMQEHVMSVCSSGEEIPQILMEDCMVTYHVNNTASTHDFIFYPRVDHKVEKARNVTVNVIGQLWQDGVLATNKMLTTVTLMMEDHETAGVCYLISEPTIKTFDSLSYYSFYQGEFVLYQHDVFPEKVHVGFQPCRPRSSLTCPCVAMIQSGDDTFIIDVCRRFGERYHALDFLVYMNNDMTAQTKVYTLPSRNFFQFVLPSGAIINIRSGIFLLDIWVKPSALDFGHTSGLCGTYDGDESNDFTLPDDSVEALNDIPRWRRNLLPRTFLSAWRPEETLFGGVLENDYTLPTEIGTKCACRNSTCTPTDIVERCDFIYGEDITSDLEKYTQIIEIQNRRKRQATDSVWDNIDYDPNNPPDQFPTWPTGSGLTEADATLSCEEALQNHASWDICSFAIDTNSIVTSCVTNILLSDSEEFIDGYVEDMKVQCKLAVLSDPTIAESLGQTQEELVTFLLTLTCINDCSNHGNCVNDMCQCESGFQGDDCSITMDTEPEIISLSENIFSGEAESGLSVISRQVVVYGRGFENSDNLVCHTEQVEVSDNGYRSTGLNSSSKGIFLTSGSVLCELSGSLPLTSLLLSVSNNGANKSNNVMYIFQDPVCYDCDLDLQICDIQPTSCVIEGQCYAAGKYNPTDECLLCDPVSNFWIFKPSTTCTTTTSTTSSTTSSSTTTTSTSSTTSSSKSTTASTLKPTSTTSSTSSPTSSSTSSTTTSTSASTKPSSSSTSVSTPAPTSSGEEGDKDTQGGDDDQESLTIVIGSGAGLIALIIIVTVIFACRLRRKDKKASEAGSTISSSDQPRKQGRSNPGYSRGEPARPIAGDPVIHPERITPLYSAAFNTEGLEGRQGGAPVIYEDDPGLHTVNIEIFDEGRDRGREIQSGQRPVEPEAQYDNAGLERRYTIPRPYVASTPAGIYSESGRDGEHADYDNATGVNDRGGEGPMPMPDYYEADDSDTVTRM